MESDDDSVQFVESDSESECPDDDDFFCEKLAILTSISIDPLEVFTGFIGLFMQSEDDELFNQIMDHVTSSEYILIAIVKELDRNYKAIVDAVGDVKERFWYGLGK